jgi:hypothetical protein
MEKKRKRQLLAQANAQKRKERTRRLIQMGALALKDFGLPDTTEPQDFEQFFSRRSEQQSVDKPNVPQIAEQARGIAPLRLVLFGEQHGRD